MKFLYTLKAILNIIGCGKNENNSNELVNCKLIINDIGLNGLAARRGGFYIAL